VHAARGALDGVDGGHVPSTLDLREALATRGPRFTMGGGPLFALHAALERYAEGPQRRDRFASYLDLGRTVRARLTALGLPALADDARAAPTITTFAPPPERRAALLAAADAAGFTLGGGSAYLRERGWLQIATMGDVTLADVERLFAALPQAAAG
jgi:aspartate aminotransferase-like enzyme